MITIGILLYVSNKFFFLGFLLGMGMVLGWVIIPIGKFMKYLATSPELARVRPRAVGVTAVVLFAVVGGVTLVPAPDHARANGVLRPRKRRAIHMPAAGFVQKVRPTERRLEKKGEPLLVATNRTLEIRKRQLEADLRAARARRRRARTKEVAQAQALEEQIRSLKKQLSEVRRRLSGLTVEPPFSGTWIAPDIERKRGAYLRRGERIGTLATLDDLIVRATADQHLGPRLDKSIGRGEAVEIRLKGRPTKELGLFAKPFVIDGEVEAILPAAQEKVPSKALLYRAGGSMAMEKPSKQQGTRRTQAKEPFFEIRVDADEKAIAEVFSRGARSEPWVPISGERVLVRFALEPKPLAFQWWRSLRQVLQQRFGI